MSALLSLIFLVGLVSSCGSAVPPLDQSNAGQGRMATVVRVVDGDTVRVDSGGEIPVRILGIDSPETVHPHKDVECGGPESSAWAKEVLPVGSTVRLEFDPGREQFDYRHRLLAFVEYRDASGKWVDFSVQSASLGHSRNYVYDNRPVSRQDMIAAAEASARAAGNGLWKCPH